MLMFIVLWGQHADVGIITCEGLNTRRAMKQIYFLWSISLVGKKELYKIFDGNLDDVKSRFLGHVVADAKQVSVYVMEVVKWLEMFWICSEILERMTDELLTVRL